MGQTVPSNIKYKKSEVLILKKETSKPPSNNRNNEIKPTPTIISPRVIITEELSLIRKPLIRVKKTPKTVAVRATDIPNQSSGEVLKIINIPINVMPPKKTS